jgi:hypothetical protein
MAVGKDGRSQGEKAQAESRVRTAAIVAAKGVPLGEGFLAHIIAQTSHLPDDAARETMAAKLTLDYMGVGSSVNYLSTPDNQLELRAAALGLHGWQRGGDFFSRMTEARDSGSSESSSRGGTYTRELAGGDVFKSLVGQGYAREHVMGAIAFAHEMGTSEEMARKFVKIGQDGQETLRKFIDGLDPSLSDEEKRKAAAEFRRGNAKVRKHMTDDDVVQTIRAHDKKQLELRGVQGAAFDDAQKKLATENRSAGIDKMVDAQRVTVVANLQKDTNANKAEEDDLAAIAQRRVAQTQPQSLPKDAKRGDAIGNPVDQPKPPQRQAAHVNQASPKMGS